MYLRGSGQSKRQEKYMYFLNKNGAVTGQANWFITFILWLNCITYLTEQKITLALCLNVKCVFRDENRNSHCLRIHKSPK